MVMSRSMSKPSHCTNDGVWVASRRVAPVHPAGHDDRQGRLVFLHVAHLYWRCVGAQQPVVVQVQRVLDVAGGMVARYVERLEIVEVALDLGAADDHGSPCA